MIKKGGWGLCVISLFVFRGWMCLASQEAAFAEDLNVGPEKVEAEALLDKYIRAFRTQDLTLASEVYAHDSDLVVYGSSPADRRLGWNQTEAYLRAYFGSVERIDIVLKERHLKVHESGKVAWFAQVLTWEETEKGKSYLLDGLRITGVLEKRERGWVIVQLHASGPPPVS